MPPRPANPRTDRAFWRPDRKRTRNSWSTSQKAVHNALDGGCQMVTSDASEPTRAEVLGFIESDPRLSSLLAAVRADIGTDPAHDLEHCLRVALWTLRIVGSRVPREQAIAAALLHDIVNVPKNSPDRARASEWSAAMALSLLELHGFTPGAAAEVADAVRTHSYSAGHEPTSEL